MGDTLGNFKEQFVLQPGIYSTGGSANVHELLHEIWDPSTTAATVHTSLYAVSGFATHNGGLPFYETFRTIVKHGGHVFVALGGSSKTSLASRQLARALLDVGANVYVVRRTNIMHAKLYGAALENVPMSLVVSSANFTTPGLKLNVEAAVLLGEESLVKMGFSWTELWRQLSDESIGAIAVTADESGPEWALLYDELAPRLNRAREPEGPVEIRESSEGGEDGEGREYREDREDEVSLVISLSHADTARIQAAPGTRAARGSQYFWLPKDAYDFFPPLTIKNVRGEKATYSALVTVDFLDVNSTEVVRVTFEAENNHDFRLGTGPLRGSRLVAKNDLAVLTRKGVDHYELRLVTSGEPAHRVLLPYATTRVGSQGKLAGYVPTTTAREALTSLGRTPQDDR